MTSSASRIWGTTFGWTNDVDLDAREAGLGQAVDDLDLGLGRDPLGLDLEAVPGTDLADRDALGKSHVVTS